jgi:predicted ATPase/DNA-binding SARP family transcriptional activator/Tfp pilus assembly protein PilF
LLAYLAFYPDRSHPRDGLIELLWPGGDLDAGRNSLSVALNSLRRQLEPPDVPAGSVVISDRTHAGLNAAAISTDALEFAVAAQTALRVGDEPKRVEALVAAVDRMSGPLLPGHYEEWIGAERDRLVDLHLTVLRRLITSLAQAQELESALDYARRALQADPLREEFHRSVMRLCVVLGRPGAALEQFAELERLLREALGAEPSTGTRELAAQIAAGIGAQTQGRRLATPVNGAENARPVPVALSQAETVSAGSSEARTATLAHTATVVTPPLGRLPVQFTRFFGRELEMERLLAWLATDAETADRSRPRLVTLAGPGGSGKTRLALEVAQRTRARFPGGVWFVPLVDLTDAERLFETIRDALDLPRVAELMPLDQIAGALSARPGLLILDNFEHLLDSGTPQVRTLMERIPSLTLMVTSRQSLDLSGEQEFALAPLTTPKRPGGPERLLEFPSVQMFVDRAQARRVDFQITRKNAADIAALCERLEGVPLAIELAAAWAKIMTPAQMLSQLDRRFAFLVSRRADLPERHRNLWAVIEGSYSLLTPELQQLFTRLSIFRGGWSLEAAAEITKEDGPRESSPNSLSALQVLDWLDQLRARSLIIAEEIDAEEVHPVGTQRGEAPPDGAYGMRYRMLETLREYARDRLTPDEGHRLATRHARYFLTLAEAAKSHLTGTDPLVWLDRLEAEHENLRAAIGWFEQERSRNDEAAECVARMTESLWQFWWIRGYLSEGRAYLKSALAGYIRSTPLRTDLLRAAGHLAHVQGDFAEATARLEESLAIDRETGDRQGEAADIGALGGLYSDQGDLAAAQKALQQALEIHREAGDRQGEASDLGGLGYIAREQGDYAAARALIEKAIEITRSLNATVETASLLGSLAHVSISQGDYEEARALFEQELALWREIGNRSGEAWTLSSLGLLAHEQENRDAARSVLEQALAINREIGSRGGEAWNMDSLGNILREQGDLISASALIEGALTINREIGSRGGEAGSLIHLGQVAQQQGDLLTARRLYRETLAVALEIGQKGRIIEGIEVCAGLAFEEGQAAQAARLIGAAEASREALGRSLSPRERSHNEVQLVALREMLGEQEMDRLRTEGRQISLIEAAAQAQDLCRRTP